MFMLLAALMTTLVASPPPVSSLPASPTPAPHASPLASPPPKVIGNVVTTAERRATPIAQTIKPTFVIDRATIENNGFDTIGEALVNVPGVIVQQFGAFGAEADYSAMGAVGGGTQVLLNGVPITAGSSGAVDLGILSTNGVDRIEVVESGSSTLYGSGASGGVINIITSVPSSTYLDLADGSFGDRLARVATGNGIVGITLERHIATNDFPYASLDGFPGGARQNDEALQTDGSIEYRRSFDRYTIRASGRATQLFIGQPGELTGLTPQNSSASNRNDVMTEISRTDGDYTTSLTLSGMRQGDLSHGGFGISGPQVSSLIDSRAGVSLKEVVTEHAHDALVAGVDLSRESALDILGPFGPPPSFAVAQSQSAAYVQQTVGIAADGKAYLGVRGEHDTPGGSILLPSAGVLLPIGSARVSVNAGSSFITPTLFDLYFPGFSNPALLPERDRTLDASLSFPRPTIAPTLTLFDRSAQNLITFNSQFVPINAGTAHFQGATMSLKMRPVAHITATFSATDLWSATQVVAGTTMRADFEPRFSSTLDVERATGEGGAGFGLQAHLQGPHTESASAPGDFGGYTTTDVYAKFSLPRHGFVTVRLKNLFNQQYGSYYAFPQPARSYRVEWTTR